MIEPRANSRWVNIYSGEKVTVKRVYHGIIYYKKDSANITIDPLEAYTSFIKPTYVFIKTYKPLNH